MTRTPSGKTGLRGWSIAKQVREGGSTAAKRHPILQRLLVASLCILSSASVALAAHLTGRFYLEKTTFGRGEPVFLYFSLVNEGPDAAVVGTGDADQPFCSGVSITVSSDPSPAFSCPSSKDNSCSYIGPPQTRQLASGQTYTTLSMAVKNTAILAGETRPASGLRDGHRRMRGLANRLGNLYSAGFFAVSASAACWANQAR